MKRLIMTILIVITTLSAQQASADGQYLLQRCQAALNFSANPSQFKQSDEMAYCYGLLQGIRELNRMYEDKSQDIAYFCMQGKHLKHREAAQLVVDYLKQNPQRLHQNESKLAVQALRQHFPCSKPPLKQ